MSDPRPRPGRGFATRAIRAASHGPALHQQPTAVPIYQTATFATEDSAELGAVLGGAPGYAYSRIDNPTAAALAGALAQLEGAQAGLAFGSGMAAIHAALAGHLAAGDRIVATRAIYGSTRTLVERVLGRLGVSVDFVDPTDLDAVEAALAPSPGAGAPKATLAPLPAPAPRARILYLETISNPTIVVPDIAALAELGHRAGAVVVVDNTFASPYLCRPVELGADIVVESATKWLGGHSDVLAGVVCGSEPLVAPIREILVDTGGIIAPFSAFLVLRGIETLAVRMDRHAANALAVARALQASADGGPLPRVFYPGLASHPQHAVAARQFRSGGGMLAVDFGRRAAAAAFIDALSVPERTASLGSVHTICVHPPSTTHRQLDAAQLVSAGIDEGLVRISVGLEDETDLLADVAAGLAAARRVGLSMSPTTGLPTPQPVGS
jgi:cystathionine beta-lyase/cystathionine gamma-synthase